MHYITICLFSNRTCS